MMEAVKKKDAALVNQVTELLQSGLNPQAIAEALVEQNRKQSEGELNGNNELFSEKILMTSQALAFRSATSEDLKKITQIINSAYKAEIQGDEAFRSGTTVTENDIKEMMEDSVYKWLVVEAPSGRAVESDGQMLGVCAFTTDGISRKNGVEEGHVGSIRYLAILPQYQGVLIGHRLLRKVEDSMAGLYDCCRVMISIPECRASMIQWALNRDYTDCSTIAYPVQATGHVLTKETPLVIFHKPLERYSASSLPQPPPAAPPKSNNHLPPIFRMMMEQPQAQGEDLTREGGSFS